MEVTNAQLYNIHPSPTGVCAKAEIEINNTMVVRNIKIINGKRGLFIAFPNDGKYNIRDGVKRYNDIFYIKDAEERDELQNLLVDMYNSAITQQETK